MENRHRSLKIATKQEIHLQNDRRELKKKNKVISPSQKHLSVTLGSQKQKNNNNDNSHSFARHVCTILQNIHDVNKQISHPTHLE